MISYDVRIYKISILTHSFETITNETSFNTISIFEAIASYGQAFKLNKAFN